MSYNQFREDAPVYDTSPHSPRYPPSGARLAEDPLGNLPIELEGSPVTNKPTSTPPTRHTFSKYGRTSAIVGPSSKSPASTSERPRAPTMTRIRAVEPWIEPISPTTLLQRHKWEESGILAPKPIRPNHLSGVVERLEQVAISMTYEDIERINQDARIKMLEADNEMLHARTEAMKNSMEELYNEILARQDGVSQYSNQACPTPVQAAKWPKEMTYEQYCNEIRQKVPWMEEKLFLIAHGEPYVWQQGHCKVGRPKGKLLRKVDEDDMDNHVCNQHMKRNFEIWKNIHPTANPWVCPKGRTIQGKLTTLS